MISTCIAYGIQILNDIINQILYSNHKQTISYFMTFASTIRTKISFFVVSYISFVFSLDINMFAFLIH